MQGKRWLSRIAYIVAAMIIVLAMSLHSVLWYRTGRVNWPVLCNMSGLLVIMLTGIMEPASKRVRLTLNGVALVLIVPSAVLLWLK